MATITTEGRIPFHYNDATYETWYMVVGNLSSRPPLVVLHGGPGLSYDYLIPLKDLAEKHDIPVIFYDQIGSGQSSHITDQPGSFWCFELFIRQLEGLLKFLNIELYDLFGHSWGATLATEFVVTRQPKGLRRLVIANCLASSKLRTEAREKLIDKLPAHVGETIRKHDANGTMDASEYKAAWRVFYEHYACRTRPMPPELLFSIAQSEDAQGGGIVLTNMRKNIMDDAWTMLDRMHLIQVPTLLTSGEYDYMTDAVCGPFFWKLVKIKWVKFAESSHVPVWEERERFIDVVRGFLN